MSYKCKICGVNEVDNQGDICELCAIGQDPYAHNNVISHIFNTTSQNTIESDDSTYHPKKCTNRKVLLNGGKQLTNQDPYGNDITDTISQSSVQIYSAGQTPQVSQQDSTAEDISPIGKSSGNQPITVGITKNLSVDSQKRSFLTKWFKALFSGIPFTFDNDITMFQVFPDFSGTALNTIGNACDQVIVYGKINSGVISENNDVEVFGRRDTDNNVIAKKIKNRASGTIVTPERTIGQGIVWIITMIFIALIVSLILLLGVTGIIWAIVIILCLTNLPIVLKIIGVVFGALFSLFRGRSKKRS